MANILLKIRNSLGAVINPRKEDGHGSAVDVPSHVSVGASALPTGAATEVTQALVKAKTDNLDIALTVLRDALRGASSKDLSTLQEKVELLLTRAQFEARINTLGRKASAASTPVVLSDEQEASLAARAAEATQVLRNNAFATLLHYLPRATTDELRRAVVGTDVYHLRAPDGTLTSAASWEAVRFYQDSNEVILRTRYRTSVVADNPSAGW